MTEAISLRAPDPEALGPIRHIVRSAHKWGGDGRKPKFRKIKEVLMRKHPEVITKAFGGNANVAAAWIKNNWYRMRGMEPPPTRGRRSVSASLSYLEVPRELFGGDDDAEMFCAMDEPMRDGKLVWVTALRTGEWKVNPIPGKKGPLVIDREFMDDLLEAWNENAWEFVTVPTYHTDMDVLANTGYVRALRVSDDPERDGHHVLRAGIEFTEPEVAEKVERGSIAGVSVHVKFGVRHQETGRTFRKVLTHLALTNIPFINGLRAFEQRLAASQDARIEDADITASYELLEELELRNVSEKERERLSGEGKAMPDGSYPIANVADLRNAIQAFGRAKNPAAVKRHIIKRARALGRTDLLPEEWSASLEASAAWREDLDYGYVRQQIEAQLRGYSFDDDGELVHRVEAPDDATAARIYVMGMTPEDVLVCACAETVSPDDAEHSRVMNAYEHGWVIGYDVSEEGEVSIDPADEWVPVERRWIPVESDEEEEEDEDEDEENAQMDARTMLPISSSTVSVNNTTGATTNAWGNAIDTTGGYAAVPQSGYVVPSSGTAPPYGFTFIYPPTSPRGGDSMADVNDQTPEESEVTLSRDELDRIADERAQAALAAYRQEQDERERIRDEELAATRRQLHDMEVRERINELTAAGHAPSVVKAAQEIMLADVRQEPILALSLEDGDVSLSATDIVTRLLDALPESAFTRIDIELPNTSRAPDSDETVDVRAERMLAFMKAES